MQQAYEWSLPKNSWEIYGRAWAGLNDAEMEVPDAIASSVRAERTLAVAEYESTYLKWNIIRGIFEKVVFAIAPCYNSTIKKLYAAHTHTLTHSPIQNKRNIADRYMY